jgi:TRAP-type C4-dicarboxylate transport system substrate-binding protein
MALVYGGMFSGSVPAADLEAGLPFSRWEVSQYIEMMWSPKYRLIDTVREGFAKKNIHLITPQGAGDYLFMLNFPIQKFADLKGHKIRGAGGPAMWLNAAGVSPVNIPGSEIYMAMKLGTIEGTLFPPMILEALKLKEVVKYIVYPPMSSPGGCITLINKDVWNSLPPGIRAGLTERTLVNYYRYVTDLYQEQDTIALEAAYKYGVKKIVLPEEEKIKAIKIAEPIWDQIGKGDTYTQKGVQIIKRYLTDTGFLK